jgi:IS66 Orf2 like protein
MITPPPGVRVYLACGYTDMRKGMATLAMLVQQTLGHDAFICVGREYVAALTSPKAFRRS